MKKIFAVVMAAVLCLTMLPAGIFAEGEDTRASAESEVTAVSPAFQQKLFTELNSGNKLILPETMTGVTLEEKSGTGGIMISGKVSALTSGRITIDEDFDFDLKPEGRKTDVCPVGRISLDGLSDKKVKVTLSVYLDDEKEPRASMLLRKQMGKAGWSREGDLTTNVLYQKITGTHRVSIGLNIEGLDGNKKTSVLLRSLTFCEDSIPVMYFDIDESEGSIDAMNASDDHSVECYGSVTLQVPEGYKSEFSAEEQETMRNLELDYIRGRGNSTWLKDKKPYKVKFDKKQDLLGMGKNKHWILLANRFDNTLLRNRITYWIVRHMGMEYAIKCSPVEVVMNGRYYGSYLLSEQVRVGENRVEIDELDETVIDPKSDEMTGGYLLNLGGYEEDLENTFMTEHGGYFEIESPEFGDYPDNLAAKAAKISQRKYIADYVSRTEAALFGNDMKDKEGHSFDEYLDVKSAADFWWIQEFSINGDAYGGGSSYLYKKRITQDGNGRLYWGPLWDFDYVAWGNPNDEPDNYTGFDNTSHAWMNRLRSKDTYCSLLKARWSALYDIDHSYDDHLSNLISEVIRKDGVLDQYYDETRVSEYYDNLKWGFYNGDEWYGSYKGAGAAPYGEPDDGGQPEQDPDDDQPDEQDPEILQTYESEIEQLRTWTSNRQEWVNKNLGDIQIPSYTVNYYIGVKIMESRTYSEGEELGTLPAAPEREGYTFTGWYDEYGFKVSEEETVFFDMNLYGKYVETSKLKKPENIYFNTYDAYAWYSPYDPEENEYCPYYELMPEDAAPERIFWSVSDPNIAEIDQDGTVRGRKPGKVTVTAMLSSGKQNSYELTFLDDSEDMYEVEEIMLNRKTLSISTGQYMQLIADQEPKPHYTSYVEWFTTDPDIVSVDDFGVVTAKKPGKTVVVAIDSESRQYALCKVTVKASPAYARKVKVTDVKARAVKKGAKRTVKVTWKEAAGVSGYYVLRSMKKNRGYKKAGTVKSGSICKWTDRNVKAGRTYYYKVRPYTKISGKVYKGKKSAAAMCTVK